MNERWLGHRDLCPLQWGEPCDCPCSADACPGVDRCTGDCALAKSFLDDEPTIEYPPLPRVPDLRQPPAVCVAWVIAAEHEEMIDNLMGAGVWYWPAVGELTTGHTASPRGH